MSSRKSHFLRMEHAREAEMSRRVTELERELEFPRHESQDRVAKVTEARAAERLAVERATAA